MLPGTFPVIVLTVDDSRLGRVQFQSTFGESLPQNIEEFTRLPFRLAVRNEVSNPEESHLRVLAEPDVNVSAHPAPIIQPPAAAPSANARTVHDHVSRHDRASASHGDGAYEVF